jgi:glycosyltransferase involved in cell wall biosynthesis
MRILQVILAFYPCQIWGGPPQNTLILSKGLQARGHQVQVLTTNILDYRTRLGNGSSQAEWKGIPVTYLKAYWWGKRSNSMGFIVSPDVWRHRQLIREADLVHIHGYRHFLFFAAALLARMYQVPYVVQARGTMNTKFGRQSLKQVVDHSAGRLVLRRAAGAVALTNAEVEEYTHLGVPKSSIAKIPNPLDPAICPELPDREPFRYRHGIKPTEKVVLFLSRLHERKGLEILIKAVAALQRPDVRLCIVGPDHGYQTTAERLTNDLGMRGAVLFTGPLYEQEKFEAYAAADVYVLPAKGGEGLPTTVIEACYAGVPIIVTNTVEISEIVDGQIGLAINYDADELKHALVEILDSPTLQQTYKQNTSSVLRQYFDLETILDRFEEHYHSVLRTNGTHPTSQF